MKNPWKTFCLLSTAAASFADAPSIQFSTYFGGQNFETPVAIAVGADGSSYVTGWSGSDLPNSVKIDGGGLAFVAKLNPSGSAVTYTIQMSGFFPRAIAVDAAGQVYLAGYSVGSGLPVTGAIQAQNAGGADAVVLKLNAAGDQVLFATYLGGAGDDGALGIALDPTSRIWIAGLTTSANFPVAAQPYQAARAGSKDGFLARLSNDGAALEYSTYFGGTDGATIINGLTLDSTGRPVVCGSATGPLPLKNSLPDSDGSGDEAFVTKFDETGRSLVFSTFLGGNNVDSATGLGLDGDGNIYVTGWTFSTDFPTRAAFQNTLAGDDDLFVSKISADGSELVYSTYLGSGLGDTYHGWPNGFGADELSIDLGGIAVTPLGRALVLGTTYGANYPQVTPVKAANAMYSLDVVATCLEPNGAVAFSTFLGGNGGDWGGDVAVAPGSGFVLTGNTARSDAQPDFPATPGAAQRTNPSQDLDGFVMKLNDASPVAANDNFANAVEITGAEASLLVQTATATKEANEPSHSGNTAEKSIWFRWTAPATGKAIISTYASSFPALLGIYHGSALNNLVPANVGSAVDKGSYSEARFNVTASEVLYIAVDGRDAASGTAILSLALSLVPNDDFANRIALTGTSASGSNVGATSERPDWAPHNVWWQWTPLLSGYYTFTTLGSDFDTAMSIFTGFPVPQQTRIVSGDYYTNQLARATIYASGSVEYYIMISGNNGETGHIELQVAPANRPPNDDYFQPTPLTGRNPPVATGTSFDSAFHQAEWDLEILSQMQAISGQMVWWEWVAPIDGAAEITTAGSTLISNDSLASTSMIIFTGDELPTERSALTLADSTTPGMQASVYLTEVHAGTRYKIGLDAVAWQHPIRYSLKIRAIAPPRIIPGSFKIENGVFKGRVEGTEGKNYRVKYSSNFVDWDPAGDHPAITGEFAFESPVAPGYRFYRIEEY